MLLLAFSLEQKNNGNYASTLLHTILYKWSVLFDLEGSNRFMA